MVRKMAIVSKKAINVKCKTSVDFLLKQARVKMKMNKKKTQKTKIYLYQLVACLNALFPC